MVGEILMAIVFAIGAATMLVGLALAFVLGYHFGMTDTEALSSKKAKT